LGGGGFLKSRFSLDDKKDGLIDIVMLNLRGQLKIKTYTKNKQDWFTTNKTNGVNNYTGFKNSDMLVFDKQLYYKIID
jgi:hypothetical protein